jgi:hypothetical protein
MPRGYQKGQHCKWRESLDRSRSWGGRGPTARTTNSIGGRRLRALAKKYVRHGRAFSTAAAQLGGFRATFGRRSECHLRWLGGMYGLWAPPFVRWPFIFRWGLCRCAWYISLDPCVQRQSANSSRPELLPMARPVRAADRDRGSRPRTNREPATHVLSKPPLPARKA